MENRFLRGLRFLTSVVQRREISLSRSGRGRRMIKYSPLPAGEKRNHPIQFRDAAVQRRNLDPRVVGSATSARNRWPFQVMHGVYRARPPGIAKLQSHGNHGPRPSGKSDASTCHRKEGGVERFALFGASRWDPSLRDMHFIFTSFLAREIPGK